MGNLDDMDFKDEWKMVQAPPPIDWVRCMGETHTSCKPDVVGPPPATHRCVNKPTWIAVEARPLWRPGAGEWRYAMSLCVHCYRTLRSAYRRIPREWPNFYPVEGLMEAAEAVWRLGGREAFETFCRKQLRAKNLYVGAQDWQRTPKFERDPYDAVDRSVGSPIKLESGQTMSLDFGTLLTED